LKNNKKKFPAFLDSFILLIQRAFLRVRRYISQILTLNFFPGGKLPDSSRISLQSMSFPLKTLLVLSGFFAFSASVITPKLYGEAEVNVEKSASPVISVRPGEEIEYTITYRNNGSAAANNVYITQVIPFNTYLSEEPGPGDADSVEYFVGGEWVSGYSPEAEKIRWLDDEVPEGSEDRVVLYTVTVR